MSDDADKSAPIVEDAGGVADSIHTTDASKPKKAAKGRTSIGKKGGAAPADDVKFEYGDVVLARLRGYPPWPARITHPDDLPANVLAQRPKSATAYCTQFFPVGDFSWLAPKDIAPLKPHQIEAFVREPHRKAAGALREAYLTAQDPTEWDAAQADKLRALEEDAADEDVDELEDEDSPNQGKRKRAAPAPKKEAKKAKTAKKGEEKPKAKAAKADKPKVDKAGAEAATPADGEPAGGEAAKVKDWRHRLQRAFLSSKVPEHNDMEGFHTLFKEIETYTEMTLDYLKHSKIDKVMRKIAQLTTVPRNDEFNITSRADKLANDYANLRRTEEGPKANGTDGKDTTPTGEQSTASAAAPAAPAVPVSEPATEPKSAADEPTPATADDAAAGAPPKEDEPAAAAARATTTTEPAAEPAASPAEDKTEA